MTKILVVGNGRVARAFLQHLSHLHQAQSAHAPLFTHWHRGLQSSLREHCQQESPTHVWLAVSDDSIAEFVRSNFESLAGRTVTHFCGGKPSFRVTSERESLQVHVAHPLTTFGDVTKAQWRTSFEHIPFVLEKPLDGLASAPKLEALLPGFKNPVFHLRPTDRAYYHALCALAGGLTVQLWQALAARFELDLELPPTALRHFLNQIGQNLNQHLDNRTSVLTGPVARGDLESVTIHKTALEERNEVLLARLYQDFQTVHRCELERSILEKRGQ